MKSAGMLYFNDRDEIAGIRFAKRSVIRIRVGSREKK
jgi:hypothetical protein